jgi:adenine-specific DNA-methyltransferase
MEVAEHEEMQRVLLASVPQDGTSISNQTLRALIATVLGREVTEATYFAARDALLAQGLLALGRGRGGSVRRIVSFEPGALALESQTVPEAAKQPKPQQRGLLLSARKPGEPARPKRGKGEEKVAAYRHKDHRTNNPEVGLVTPDDDPGQPKTAWAYDPHLDPALQFDSGRAELEALIDDALSSGDTNTMRAALAELKRRAAPYLNWAGKAERTSFAVDTVSLHVHERIDPATILAALRKRLRAGNAGVADAPHQDDWLQAWFEQPLPLREAIEFYKHDRGWSNRLIAGDSLLVMNSLLTKEGMAGQVQMIYIDPPYGIKYGSNFQPFVNKRDVKDRKDEDLTAEPEMIKAFRDTWELGIHSYLTYLRDRLLLARELLHESGSVFVQISEDNLHLVRNLMDEVFGCDNGLPMVIFRKTTGAGSPSGYTDFLPQTCDFLLWYAKNKRVVKFNRLFASRDFSGDANFRLVKGANGQVVPLKAGESPSSLPEMARLFRPNPATSQTGGATTQVPVNATGKTYSPGQRGWSTSAGGMERLNRASRLMGIGDTLTYVRYADDFPNQPVIDIWDDTRQSGFGDPKVYVVQTATKVIERCLLMTTDPGDLVLDPTCGSGTTAFVAEKWGRRWITCDTSRVAVTLAKQRLMTVSYDYYDLRYPNEGLKAGFIYKTVPHVTLKSIANNPEIDEIHAKLYPAIAAALVELSTALRAQPPAPYAVTEGGRKGAKIDFAAPTDKTVKLPSGEDAPAGALLEWEVPFEFPAAWPRGARAAFEAFHAARQAMQRRMDQSIAAHADQETLYDQPQVNRDKLRITGPFTVEAVPFATVQALGDEAPPREADASVARSGESARQHGWRDELLKTGIRGRGGQMLKFAELETLPGTRYLHCTGALADSGERVVVSFGPEYAALERRQVELAMREAGELFPRPKMIVFCAFVFDPEAAKDIGATKGIVALKAEMNTDLLTADLKKARASNQSFWLMGQPDVALKSLDDGRYVVEVHGFDYFDTARGELISGGKGKIAAWMLDTDYDQRSLFPRQVFFPMAGAKDGWNKLKRDIKAELDETLMEQFHGTVSLPFEPGEHRRIAVKIVDDRGIESLKVITLE